MPADGSLVRARVAGGQLYYQRVAAPGPGADFSSWTALEGAAEAGIALAAGGESVLLFYVGSDGATIYLRESADSGQSLGPATALTTAPAAVGWLAAALKADGTALLLYSVGGTVYRLKRSGGVWGSPQAWPNSAASITGLACHYEGDFNIVVCGSDAEGAAWVWTCIYGDGFSQALDTWSPLREMNRASPGAGMEFRAPSLSRPDVYRLFFVERYTPSQPYSRPYFSYMPVATDYADNLWREPVPFDLASEYGLALVHDGSYAWLSSPSGVWRAPLNPAPLDLSADVLELTMEEGPFGGRAQVLLRNDDGRYLGPPAPLRLGAEVKISPGYITAGGPQSSSGPAGWIVGYEYSSGGRATLRLHLRDAWWLLEGWRARRQFAWAAGERNVFQLLAFILARAGLPLSALGATSPSLANLYPAFTIHPGERGDTALRRLLSLVPDVLLFRGYFGYVKEPRADEASTYAYGTEHPILRGRYSFPIPQANRFQVFGQGLMVEAFDWADIEGSYDRLRQAHDLNLTTEGQAQERAEAELRRAALGKAADEIAVPVNCGQELYDVVTITDPPAGLQEARRRVLGLSLRFRPGQYQQELRLGGV